MFHLERWLLAAVVICIGPPALTAQELFQAAPTSVTAAEAEGRFLTVKRFTTTAVQSQIGGPAVPQIPGTSVIEGRHWKEDAPGLLTLPLTGGAPGAWTLAVSRQFKSAGEKKKGEHSLLVALAELGDSEADSRLGVSVSAGHSPGRWCNHSWKFLSWVGSKAEEYMSEGPVFSCLHHVRHYHYSGDSWKDQVFASQAVTRATTLFPDAVEVRYIGVFDHVIAGGEHWKRQSPQADRFEDRSIHIIVRWRGETETVEVLTEIQSAPADWRKIDEKVFAPSHRAWKTAKKNRNLEVKEGLPKLPFSRHALFKTSESIGAPLVFLPFDPSDLSLGHRPRALPLEILTEASSRQLRFVGSWIEVAGDKKSGEKILFRSPYAKPIDLDKAGAFRGKPSLRALIVELEQNVFPSQKVDRYGLPFQRVAHR